MQGSTAGGAAQEKHVACRQMTASLSSMCCHMVCMKRAVVMQSAATCMPEAATSQHRQSMVQSVTPSQDNDIHHGLSITA
jgi:hypothetical protein